MLDTLGIVEVACRTSSSSLDALDRIALDRFALGRIGGTPLLEWVIRRVTESQLLDGVIAVCHDDVTDDILRHIPPDVPVLKSGHDDSVQRVADAIRRFPAAAIVRVALETPFVDPVLIDRLISTAQCHPECDYVGYCSADGKPLAQSPLGLFAEWCKASAIRRVARMAKDAHDEHDATHYIYSHPDIFQLRLIPAPEQLDRDDLRLTLHAQEDWEHAETILDALGPDALSWQRIAGLLDQQPQLRERMANLNRAEAVSQI